MIQRKRRRPSLRRSPYKAIRGGRARTSHVTGSVAVKKTGGYVHQIRYQDGSDGKNYKHDFGDLAAIMYLCESPGFGKCLLIAPLDDVPLWEDA